MRLTRSWFFFAEDSLLFQASQYGRASLCSSIPIHKPRPRTSFTAELRMARQLLEEVFARFGGSLNEPFLDERGLLRVRRHTPADCRQKCCHGRRV
jgi:hypothetical protein